MKAVILLLLVALVSAKTEVELALENDVHPLSAQMVDVINNAKTTWKAQHFFKEQDLEQVKIKLGVLDHIIRLPEIDPATHFNLSEEIPKEFDSRKKWVKCNAIISDVRDQANCGSCWAFAAVGAMSDRICIASNGEKQVKVSSDDLLTCCNLFSSFSFCGFGCNGGMPPLAWRYWVKKGIVSGGNYNDTNTCRPYELKPCDHHVDGSKNPCTGNSRTPKCEKKCVNGADYSKDKTFGEKSYSLSGEENIQREILAHGPVEAAFTVMSDFPNYKTGVYQAQNNVALGGHAVRIIGWGEENSTPYWLIANSWNPHWGDKGYFKILRGSDHCGIESQITAGIPKL